MNYKEMLKSTADKLRRQFAPRADRRALESAIDHTAEDIIKLNQQVDLKLAESIGKFGEVLPEIAKMAFEAQKKEFALSFLQKKYKTLFEKDYVPDVDTSEDDTYTDLAESDSK